MELGAEEISLGSADEKYSLYTYCRTEMVTKTYTSVWNLHDFWTIYESTCVIKLNTDDEQLPFDVILKVDRINEKFIFYVKGSPTVKNFIYNVILQSVVSEKFYIIPSHYDGEQFSYEVTKSTLVEQLKGFVSRNTLRVIVKVRCIECILHNSINTTTLHDYAIQNYKADIRDLPACESSAFVAFKVDEKEILINTELLCARSEYFKQLFKSNKQENRTIYVDDASVDVVITFKTFIQHGNTSFLKYADVYRLLSLFTMAKRYDVKDLQTVCEQYLKELLLLKENVYRCDTSLDILLFAYENDAKDLLEFTIDFVAININDHIDTKKFSDVIHKYPELLTLLKEAKINTRKAFYAFE